MKNRFIVMAAAIVLACSAFPAQAKIILDITPLAQTDKTGAANIGGGFQVSNTQMQPTGTGVFDPFLTIQQTRQERGFNWHLTGNNDVLDEKAGSSGRTDNLLLSDLQTVNIDGKTYFAFKLDVNQAANGPISLNQLQIFQSAAPLQPTVDQHKNPTNFTLQEAAADRDALLTPPGVTTEVFRLNGGIPGTVGGQNQGSYEVQIDSAHGSGSGDMFFYVLASNFKAAYGNYVTLFSQFGHPNGQYASDAGFEEWGALKGENDDNGIQSAPVPPTALLLLSGLATLGLGRVGLRLRRKKEAAV